MLRYTGDTEQWNGCAQRSKRGRWLSQLPSRILKICFIVKIKLQRKYAIQLREALTQLGPSFVKFGQALSIRPGR